MKYLLTIILTILFISPIVMAQDITEEVDSGNLSVVFTPSPDPRAEKHIIYVKKLSTNEEFNYHLPLGVNEKVFSEEELLNGETYIISATAVSETLNMESERSNNLNLVISKDEPNIPPEKPIPPKKKPTPPGQLKKGNR